MLLKQKLHRTRLYWPNVYVCCSWLDLQLNYMYKLSIKLCSLQYEIKRWFTGKRRIFCENLKNVIKFDGFKRNIQILRMNIYSIKSTNKQHAKNNQENKPKNARQGYFYCSFFRSKGKQKRFCLLGSSTSTTHTSFYFLLQIR